MLIDVFTYTQASPNAPLDIESLIRAAKSARLDGIAVTDRNSSNRAREYSAIAGRENFFVAHGIELETSAGRVVAFPAQIDDEYVSESWRSLGDHPAIEDVLEFFHARGGIVVARDVFNRGEGLKDRVYSARDSKGRSFDAIDTISVYRRRIDNELSIEAQQVLGIPACAGSGVFDNPEDIGHCATLFAASIHDQASFVAAMRSPLHWACALRDLGPACPMGTPPRTEEDDRHRDDRRRGERRFDGRRDGERRSGRGNEERRGDDRRNDRRRNHSNQDDRRHNSRTGNGRGRRR